MYQIKAITTYTVCIIRAYVIRSKYITFSFMYGTNVADKNLLEIFKELRIVV